MYITWIIFSAWVRNKALNFPFTRWKNERELLMNYDNTIVVPHESEQKKLTFRVIFKALFAFNASTWLIAIHKWWALLYAIYILWDLLEIFLSLLSFYFISFAACSERTLARIRKFFTCSNKASSFARCRLTLTFTRPSSLSHHVILLYF